MSDGESKKSPDIPGRFVWLLAVLTAAGCALFYGGLAQLPTRVVYAETPAVETVDARPTAAPVPVNSSDWLQDPLAVCAECHTPTEAERFRKIIAPLIAVYSGYGAGAVAAPGFSYAPPHIPAPVATPAPASSPALVESK